VLLAGATGLGKTALVRMVAQTLGLPLFEASTATWILTGTSPRGALQTWPSLLDFLGREPLGVIFLDEIDKLTADREWTTYLRLEIYALLDRSVPVDMMRASRLLADQPPTTAEQKVEQEIAQRHLRRGMLVIAAGAFQSFWEATGVRRVGFAAAQAPPTPTRRPALQSFSHLLPRELLNRFRAQVVYLEPMRLSGYVAMLHHTAKRLPEELVEPFLELGYESAFAAVESQLGLRWIEELITETLAQQAPSKGADDHVPRKAA
jgi:SpoVK/Ycf46/Vps4 family AAA+-type ATPase